MVMLQPEAENAQEIKKEIICLVGSVKQETEKRFICRRGHLRTEQNSFFWHGHTTCLTCLDIKRRERRDREKHNALPVLFNENGSRNSYYAVAPIQMKETEKAWLACAVDGEGSVIFQICRYKHGHPVKHPIETPSVMVYNTDLAFIRECSRLTGARVLQRTPHSPRKIEYRIRLSGTRCVEVLRQIAPFMIIKRKKAERAIALKLRTPRQYIAERELSRGIANFYLADDVVRVEDSARRLA